MFWQIQGHSLLGVVYKAKCGALIKRHRRHCKMKTSVAVLTLSLFYICMADHRAESGNSAQIPNMDPACVCAGDVAGSQKNNCHLVVTLRDLEARLRNTEKQLEDLRGEVRGKNIL